MFVISLGPRCSQSLFYRVIIEFDRRVREIVILISYSYASNVLMEGADLPFGGRKCSEMYLKIPRYVITPWHMPSMGVARSVLWAPWRVQFACGDRGERCLRPCSWRGICRLSFQLSLTMGSREVGHRQQLLLNVDDCEKSRRDMLDDSINFVIYYYYRT